MPAAYARVGAALQAQVDNPRLNDGLADAACCAVLDVARELSGKHPEYAEAFQSLANHLGYC